jgi:hypothetical protein
MIFARYLPSQTSGRISKIGDVAVREALYMMTKPLNDCSQLKSWAMRIASEPA